MGMDIGWDFTDHTDALLVYS